eukprot:jgi/Mesvir1/1776/Mv09624-RA.1
MIMLCSAQQALCPANARLASACPRQTSALPPLHVRRPSAANLNVCQNLGFGKQACFRPPSEGPSRRARRHEFCIQATSASNENEDGELDGKFQPIDTESDFRLGPEVVLLVGFTKEELEVVEDFVKGIGAEFLEVKLCSTGMMKGTLMQALDAPVDAWEKEGIATPPQRVVILSGLSGVEIIEFVEMFQDELTYMAAPAFAAAVPRNVNKSMAQLMEEVWGDHTSAGGAAA